LHVDYLNFAFYISFLKFCYVGSLLLAPATNSCRLINRKIDFYKPIDYFCLSKTSHSIRFYGYNFSALIIIIQIFNQEKTHSIMKTFGERLKHLIKTSDLKTIKRFAESTGLHPVSVSNIVRGERNPSFEAIMACLGVFPGEQVLWLITGKDNQTELELENKQLKEKVGFYERKLRSVAKFSSNRINPQLPFKEFQHEKALIFA
jgi:transcriptional regulator with XRE-family HTH domain